MSEATQAPQRGATEGDAERFALPTCDIEQLMVDVDEAGLENDAELRALAEYVAKLGADVEPLTQAGRIPWRAFVDLIDTVTGAVLDDLSDCETPQRCVQVYMMQLAELVQRYSE